MNSQWEEVVISGISGKFPECDNVDDFFEKLLAGESMISDENIRFPPESFDIPKVGLLKDISQFDAEFFEVHGKLAKVMDPQSRILLELCYEAIIDAGVNPTEIRGTNTAVYLGQCGTEYGEFWKNYTDTDLVPYKVMGLAPTLFANRISFSFNIHGPSIALDTACSASMTGLHEAVKSIRLGKCDRALVAGTKLIQSPESCVGFSKMQMLSPDGISRPFDEKANGFVRAEAICAIFIQKKSLARRYYAEIVNIDANTDGYKEKGLLFPSYKSQQRLMESVYSEANINPASVEYLEAHGTGTQAGDPEEMKAAAAVFCINRETSLLVGSVKSNMGHSEPVSGLCSLAKAIFIMEKGVIPQNLNFESPNKNIPSILNGKIKVVDKHIPYMGGYIALNNFGFGGSNVHTLLRRNPKEGYIKQEISLPKLIVVSGRTEDGVKKVLEKIEKLNNDNILGLIHEIYSLNIGHHPFRGYSLFENKTPLTEVVKYDEHTHHPVWYIYPGMGPQWAGMGKDLMQFEVFRESVKKCSAVLEPNGKDFYNMIVNGKEVLVDRENMLVSIIIIQIALTDLLKSIDIQPDGIIGHSNGEIVAAYADGALTLEQTVLCIYYKNRSFLEANNPPGALASVGLSWSEAEARCPPGIYPACDNSDDNITISGPVEDIREFIKCLKSENIFVREVDNCLGYAFHSKYIKNSGPLIRNYLEKVIPCPKKRSSRWISTSINVSNWDSDLAQNCSVEYFVNNTLSTVYFREAVKKIPENAVIIEVAPHSLFRSILKRSLPQTCSYVGLAKMNDPDNVEFILSSFGKMYNAGLQPKIQNLYPKIEYPVPRGTPMLSTMVEWDHSKEWKPLTYNDTLAGKTKVIFQINLLDPRYYFLKDHVIDNHIIYPAAGYLLQVWKGLSYILLKKRKDMPVIFHNVRLHRATILKEKSEVHFHVDILNETGEFEIRESGCMVASGRVNYIEDPDSILMKSWPERKPEGVILDKNDIYKEMRIRGYYYCGDFQGICKVDTENHSGEVEWNNNWVSYIDTVLQFSGLACKKSRNLFLPTMIEQLILDPRKLITFEKGTKVPVRINTNLGVTEAAGLEVSRIRMVAISKINIDIPPVLEKYTFVPYECSADMQVASDDDILTVIVQIVMENCRTRKPHIVENAGSKEEDELLGIKISNILKKEPMIYANITEVVTKIKDSANENRENAFEVNFILQDTHFLMNEDINFLIASNPVTATEEDKNNFFRIVDNLKFGSFILLEVTSTVEDNMIGFDGYERVSFYASGEKQLILLKKCAELSDPSIVHFSETNYQWIEKLKFHLKNIKNSGEIVIVVCQGEKTSGIMGLMNCLREEASGNYCRCVFIQDNEAPLFSLDNDFYRRQLKKDLFMNVYSNKQWGSYRHLKLRNSEVSEAEHAHIDILTPGNLSTLTWIQSPTPASDDPNLCYVYYSALNFRDVMLTTGRLPLTGEENSQECTFGFEFSGKDRNGRRVFGMVEKHGMATTLITNPSATYDVPDDWTLEQAATVPVAYLTAYYSLVIRGRLKEGQSILIHAGAGGVGLAAINISLHIGAIVYTTVGSQEKREYLKKTFPILTDRNIANSRDTSFEGHIMNVTEGRGVDLVLNSLAEEKLQASVRCLAKNGKFLEIGQYDMMKNTSLGMYIFLKNISFHGITIQDLHKSNSDELYKLQNLFNDGIKSGAVQPLPVTVFTEDEVLEAFKFLGSAKHIGKVLLKIREEELEQSSKPKPKLLPSSPRIYFNPKKVYIIIGGLGGFGLELTNWMILRGARNIVLGSRTGVKNGYQASYIKEWQTFNVSVKISTSDCTEEKGAEDIIKESLELGDVGGVFNLAMVLKDTAFENMTEDDFEICCKPKINITKHLDKVSRNLCPELEYFVVFSSVVCGRGNTEQSNYGFANSVMERICEARKYENLPALAIQWGSIGDVGYVAELLLGKNLVVKDLAPQKLSSCLSTLDLLLLQQHPVVSSMCVNDKSKIKTSKNVDIIDIIGDILGISNIKQLSPQTTLTQIGGDSFIIATIQQTLDRDFSIVLTTNEIRNLTLGKLKEMECQYKNSSRVGIQDNMSKEIRKVTDVPNDWLPTNVPTEVLVNLSSENSTVKRNVNIFFVHPIQGVVSMLKPLASSLPAHVWGLQCTADAPCDSVSDLAAFYLKHIQVKQPKGPYLLSGYSYGTVVCFEIALQLEKIGESVTLILIDGTTDKSLHDEQMFQTLRMQNMENINSETLAIAGLLNYCGYDYTMSVIGELMKCKSFEERVSIISEIIHRDLGIPIIQIKEGALLFHRRLSSFLNNKTTENFFGDAVLIRSVTCKQYLTLDTCSKLCGKQVKIFDLDGTHGQIIMEKHLLDKIRDIFLPIIDKFN